MWRCAVGWVQTLSFMGSSAEQRNPRSSPPNTTTWGLSSSLTTPSPRGASRLTSSLVSHEEWSIEQALRKEMLKKYYVMSRSGTVRNHVFISYLFTGDSMKCKLWIYLAIFVLWTGRAFQKYQHSTYPRDDLQRDDPGLWGLTPLRLHSAADQGLKR